MSLNSKLQINNAQWKKIIECIILIQYKSQDIITYLENTLILYITYVDIKYRYTLS